MDGNYLTLAVHDEYARRMDDEHKRQNKRITDLEEKVEDIGALTASVSKNGSKPWSRNPPNGGSPLWRRLFWLS